MYQEQIKRIKTKLIHARKVDTNFDAFGAKSHKYKLGKCASQSEITKFEKKYNFELPLCYKAFLLEVGNGGVSHSNSAAGPFYGIYPLNKNLDEIIDSPETYLRLPATIKPCMSDEEWERESGKLDDDLTDEEYEQEMGRLYAGVMPIGSQGCTYLHALMVAGDNVGMVVNIDFSIQKPQFCFEANFLDWYERWLDEVISGELLVDGPTWFGYTIGGDASELLKTFEESEDIELKFEALHGMTRLLSANKNSCEILKQIASEPNKKLGQLASQLLTKFSYPESKSILSDLIEGDDSECLAACQALYWYQREHSHDWLDQLRNRMKRVKDEKTFDFMIYLIEECKIDYGYDLLPFLKSSNLEIKKQSFYMLGKLKNKQNYLSAFIDGLKDDSSRIVHTTIQALEGVKDRVLLKEYFMVIQRYPKEKNCVLINLKNRLKEHGFKNSSDFINRYDPELDIVVQRSAWFGSIIDKIFNKKK